jgi:hypothetical protein
MSKGNTTENDFMLYTFNGTAFSWTAVVKLDVHLHTADPGEAGTSSTSEAAYGSYALVQVDRTSGGWTVAGNQATNAALIQFPQCSSGTESLTHVSITPRASTQILYSGALSSPLAVSAGIQPQFAASSLVVSED